MIICITQNKIVCLNLCWTSFSEHCFKGPAIINRHVWVPLVLVTRPVLSDSYDQEANYVSRRFPDGGRSVARSARVSLGLVDRLVNDRPRNRDKSLRVKSLVSETLAWRSQREKKEKGDSPFSLFLCFSSSPRRLDLQEGEGGGRRQEMRDAREHLSNSCLAYGALARLCKESRCLVFRGRGRRGSLETIIRVALILPSMDPWS